MTARILYTLTGLVLVSNLAFAGDPLKEGSFSARSDGTVIFVRWVSQDEAGVVRFEVERKAGLDGQFFLLSEIQPRGDNSAYEYVDDSAFRVTETVYKYRIKVAYADGSSVYSPEIVVPHTVSDVRRTWGSIKAMFR
jgi:hypothetical protein